MKFPPVSQSSLTAMIQKLVLRDNWEGKKRICLRKVLTINKPFFKKTIVNSQTFQFIVVH